MNLEEMKKRLQAVVAELEGFKAKENLVEEDFTVVNGLNDESESLRNKIQTIEALNSNIANSNASTRQTTPVATATPTIQVGNDRKYENGNYGYESKGEYFVAVKNFAMGKTDDKILKVKNAQQEAVGTDGGFLVPVDMVSEIQRKLEGDESLLSRTRQFNTKGNRASLMVNESAPWDGSGQNIAAHWMGEGKQYTESKAKFEEVEIKAEKLGAFIPVTEELMEDSALIESFIRQETPEVFVAAINNAIISGNGIKKPTGILNSGFGFEVAKEAAQTADTINFENVKKLYTHALPRAKRNGIFLYNVGVEEQLIGMKLDASSSDSPSVYLPNASIDSAPYGTLWGKPVYPMIGAMPKLGDSGDIIFVDLSYYYSVLKVGGLKQQVSTDFLFDTDEVAFKYSFRMGGRCPFKAPATSEYGAYGLSGFTKLQERA